MQISHLSKPTSTMSESEKRTRTSQSKDRASASSSSKTPRREFFTHNGSKRSPVSPTRITRLQEKEEMQSLNDRLIIYIDTVRALQDENRQLRTDMSHFNEGSTREVTEIKVLYERELEDAKRLIDELAKEKAKFEIEVNKYKASYQEANEKLNRALKESKVAFYFYGITYFDSKFLQFCSVIYIMGKTLCECEILFLSVQILILSVCILFLSVKILF